VSEFPPPTGTRYEHHLDLDPRYERAHRILRNRAAANGKLADCPVCHATQGQRCFNAFGVQYRPGGWTHPARLVPTR